MSTQPCFDGGCQRPIVKPWRATATSEVNLAALQHEIDHRVSLFDRCREVGQFDLGSGTPMILADAGRARRREAVDRAFRIDRSEHLDFAIEVDRRTGTPEHITFRAEPGFNRLSLGVPDVDPEVQPTFDRIRPLETVKALLEAARRLFRLDQSRPDRLAPLLTRSRSVLAVPCSGRGARARPSRDRWRRPSAASIVRTTSSSRAGPRRCQPQARSAAPEDLPAERSR